jgi:hypothetical protein
LGQPEPGKHTLRTIPSLASLKSRSLFIDQFTSLAQVTPEKCGALYFYFSYDDKELNEEKVIRCLLKQLVFRLDSVPRQLDKDYENWTSRDIRPTVESLVNIFSACLESFEKIFIFLDAYDEYPKKRTSTLLKTIKTLFGDKVKQQLYMCITTRPHLEDDLTEKFEGARILKISAPDKDIIAYIRQQLEGTELHDDLKRDIEETIRDKSQRKYP